MYKFINLAIVAETLLFSFALHGEARPSNSRQEIIRMVEGIKRADYEGDRDTLKRLHASLTPFAHDKQLASRVQYWRAFALWRRAINGFNERVEAKDLEADLQEALDEFEDAAEQDQKFVEARIGSLSCLGLLAFSTRKTDPARSQDLIAKIRKERAGLEAEAPENPRLIWVLGPMLWNAPPETGGGQDKAIEMYKKGLELMHSQKLVSDPLEPSWGEPELLMSLAWSNLNRTTPDLDAAEKDADAARRLVPYWHYVKDMLLPQIREAGQTPAIRSDDPHIGSVTIAPFIALPGAATVLC